MYSALFKKVNQHKSVIYVFGNDGSEDVIHNNINIPIRYSKILNSDKKPFVVFEYVSNYPLLNGVMAYDEIEAYQIVEEQIKEIHKNDKDFNPDEILLSVEQLNFNQYG